MKVIDDGIIKYDRTNFSQSAPLSTLEYAPLEYWREKLFELSLIGEYPIDKVGYGNASMVYDYSELFLSKWPQFLITGTQTGKYAKLNGSHYTRILDYNIPKLEIAVNGPIEASSESLTHAAIYRQNKNIKAIFHIHSEKIWTYMKNNSYPATAETIPYGTAEMAEATQNLVGSSTAGIFCMLGHQDGVVSYGKTLEEAWEYIFTLYERTN